MVLLAYTLVSIQRSDLKELPVPISEVMERLVDLEKSLLIQEKKNEDLERRFLEEEILNKVQWDIIQKMSYCDCTPKEMATTYLSDKRYFCFFPLENHICQNGRFIVISSFMAYMWWI